MLKTFAILALAAGLTITSQSARAGSLDAPVMAPAVIVEETASSANADNVIVMLILAAVFAAVVAG